MDEEQRTGVIGRLGRLALGAALTTIAFPYYLYPLTPMRFLVFSYHSSLESVLLALGGVSALTILFTAIHYAISRYFPNLNAWLGAVLATAIPILVFLLSSGGGKIAVLTFLGISLILAGIRRDAGCEVMTIPNMIFRRRTQLACILFTPIDEAEKQLRRK